MSSSRHNFRRPPIQERERKRVRTSARPFSIDERDNTSFLPDIRVQRQKPVQRSTFDDGREERPTFRVPDTPHNDLAGPSRSQITVTPVRTAAPMSQEQSSRTLPVIPGSAPRMLATPARPQARTVQEQIGRTTPLGLAFLPSRATPRPTPLRQTPRLQTMTAHRGPSCRSVSKSSEKVTRSFPAVSLEPPDSEDSSGEDENFKISKPTILSMRGPLPPFGHRAARKTNVRTASQTESRHASQRAPSTQTSLINSDLVDKHTDESEDDLYVDADPDILLHRAQRLRDGDNSDDEEETKMPEDLEKELCDVLNALTIREVKLHSKGRLPFLRRNLRKSMDNLGPSKWREHDPNVVRSRGISKVNVIYLLVDYESSGGSFSGKWFCPLCAIKMWFNTRGALDTHIYQYHTQCGYEWKEDEDNTLLLKIIAREVPDSDTETEENEDSVSEEEEEPASEAQGILTPRRSTPPPEEKPFLRGSSVARAQTVVSSSPVKVQPVSPQLSLLRPGQEADSKEVARPPRPIDPEDPERYPTPPPLNNLEGPAAVYPYISEDTYSARPGGPKLYDLLNELSMEPFGLMSWYIIEKEEDIFELDDKRDEDKVMLALWGRWIFLNRTRFVQNYEKGIRHFIDEYWRMIHRAAGFAALRIFLLNLVQNRFLTGDQFVSVLRYYMDLVGMDHWK